MKKPLKFIHITKTAGTSVSDLGYMYNFLWGKFHSEYGSVHEFFPNKNIKLKEKYDWFTIVRNPYTRIVSEFYWQHSQTKYRTRYTQSIDLFNNIIRDRINTRSKTGDHWSEQHKYIDKNYPTYVLKFETLKIDFENLIKYHDNKNIEFLQRSNRTINKIFNESHLDRKTLDLINEIYELDFLYFNYTKR